jgi:hypothetical protein
MMSSSFAGVSLLIRMIDCGDLLNGCGRFAPERAFSCGHLVKHNAEREQVGARIQVLPECLFRGHIGSCKCAQENCLTEGVYPRRRCPK